MWVEIYNDMAFDMLMERVYYWTDDSITSHLYEQMYENYIDDGYFDDGTFNIMMIVDNDYVNCCTVISEGDEAYQDIKKLYNEQGITDISCESGLNHGYSFIEAEYCGNFLVRS